MITSTTSSTTSSESLPKRIRSASARLFNSNTASSNIKRFSYQSTSSSSSNSIFNAKWFPRIRKRRASASSITPTFSIVFSSSPTKTIFCQPTCFSFEDKVKPQQHQEFTIANTLSSELEVLYREAKEEIAYAIESQGSIYYEGDVATANAAFELCESKFATALQILGDTTNAVKFRFRWETDLQELRLLLENLPTVTHSIYQ
ncbi:hypothetical protein A0J61_03323 [Choanephora cucurbitarum]|uniref:Uncharacterized protein n=1 Tax=Choanephora cucurbitarum TaxID=101091 RepID=A0A1C7NHN0_9FUNG|nr:hypothetical protein A0J61_03323 [Choanephora cucurbitarum]